MGGIAFTARVRGVDEVLEAGPPFFIALTETGEVATDVVGGVGVMIVLHGEVGVSAPDKEHGGTKDEVELHIDGASRLEGNGPNCDDDDGDANLHQ